MAKDSNQIELERQAQERMMKGKDARADRARDQERYAPPKPGCFAHDTPILCPSGWQHISALQEGQEVVSISRADEITTRHVLKRIEAGVRRIWNVELDGTSLPLRVTWGHPFRTSAGWAPTWRLAKIGHVMSFDRGSIAERRVLRVQRTSEFAPVFNLVTSIDNTFIANGAIVHNFGVLRQLRSALSNLGLPETTGVPALGV